MHPKTSRGPVKGGRERFSAAMHETMEFYQNPKNGRAHTLFKTAAALLYPRFVCWESWWLQNMLISA